MEFEEGFNTLGQGKEFEKLGVTAQSRFIWAFGVWDIDEWRIIDKENKAAGYSKSLPAYSSAELGVMLPSCLYYHNFKYSIKWPEESDGDELMFLLWSQKLAKQIHRYYYHSDDSICDISSKDLGEAQAKADLALKLIKEGLIKPEELAL